MESHSAIDRLLDDWEELLESNPQLSLERFIQERLGWKYSAIAKEFRQKAEQLASINRQLERVAGSPLPVNHAQQLNDGDLRLSALQPGLEPLHGYTLVSRLGGGGFGEVWKAKSPGGFHVALKFVPIGERIGEIEKRSLDVIKDVRHPNLLSVFGAWQVGDLLIIATELADRTLLDRFHEAQKEGHKGIPIEELLVYFAEAAKGIDALNDPGKSGRMRIQHRDIKPQNLLLSGGSVKVGDFGLARSIQHDFTGHTGSLTFAYAAPECFDGTTSSHSDQYSLAITYCHLRGGRLPFDGAPVEIMEGHRKKQPDLSMISAEERPAVAKALAKLPKDRWKSCTEFVQAVLQPPSSAKPKLPHKSQWERARKADAGVRTSRRPKVLGQKWQFAGVVTVLFVACGTLIWFNVPSLWHKPSNGIVVAQAPAQQHNVQPPMLAPPITAQAPVPAEPGKDNAAKKASAVAVKKFDNGASDMDLLKRVDPKVDSVSGTWRIKAGVLECEAKKDAKIAFPVRPDGDYHVIVKFSRVKGTGGGPMLCLPVGVHSVQFATMHPQKFSALELVDGAYVDHLNNPTRFKGQLFKVDEPHTVDAVVKRKDSQATIRVELDGKLVVDWSGNPNRFSLNPAWSLVDDTRIGLRSWDEYRFHSVQLQMLSGNANWLRASSKKDTGLSVPMADQEIRGFKGQ